MKMNVNDSLPSYLKSLEDDNSVNSGTTTESHSTSSSPSLVVISQGILFVIIYLVGLLGNTLVIFVVARFPKMRTITNKYIVNLAIADMILLMGIPFLLVTIVKDSWIFGEIMCKTHVSLSIISQFGSGIFLLVISVDRYIAMYHSISSKFRTTLISNILCGAGWISSIILSIPLFSSTSHVVYEIPVLNDQSTTHKACIVIWNEDTTDRQKETMFTLLAFIFNFVVPLGIPLILVYLIKLKTIRLTGESEEKKKNRRDLANLVLVTATARGICWLPYWITCMTMTFTSSDTIPSRFFQIFSLIALCVCYLSSAVNPILYVSLSDHFKEGFLKAYMCRTEEVLSISPSNEEECDAPILVSGNNDFTTAINLTRYRPAKETRRGNQR